MIVLLGFYVIGIVILAGMWWPLFKHPKEVSGSLLLALLLWPAFAMYVPFFVFIRFLKKAFGVK